MSQEAKWANGESVLPQARPSQSIEWEWAGGESGNVVADEYVSAGGNTYDETLVLGISGSMDRGSVLSAINAASLALSMDFVRSVTAELNAGLSLAISAEQGTGSAAEMDAVIALSLAMAMLQAGDIDTGAQIYDEAVTLALAAGMSQAAIGNLQEAVTLALVAGQGQWGIVPRIAAERHLYNALARKREYDATARKREYDEE